MLPQRIWEPADQLAKKVLDTPPYPLVCVCLSSVSSSGRGVFIDIGYHVYNYLGAGEMAKLLRALAAFLEDLGLISSTHMVAHKL